MQNKSNNYRKRIINHEYQPPEKKLISDADVHIKKLSKKQQNTQTSLEKELLKTKEFYKATEFLSLTEYTAGPSTLEQFNCLSKHSDEVERLKSYGLNNEDIKLYLESGEQSNNRKVNREVIDHRLGEINEIITQNKSCNEVTSANCNRRDFKLILATKPQSIETKLLKFALENDQAKNEERLPHPMDDIKSIEAQLNDDLSPVDIKKIRKKARRLNKEIKQIQQTSTVIVPQWLDIKVKKNPLRLNNSKWDLKEPHNTNDEEVGTSKNNKIFSCKKEPNWYTIHDGKIIKIEQKSLLKDAPREVPIQEKLKKSPKLVNYETGTPSKVLYLKNLPTGVNEDELTQLFNISSLKNEIRSIKVMNKGKMRGQAFVNFTSVQPAEEALNRLNGSIFKNKPIIIEFGRGGETN